MAEKAYPSTNSEYTHTQRGERDLLSSRNCVQRTDEWLVHSRPQRFALMRVALLIQQSAVIRQMTRPLR